MTNVIKVVAVSCMGPVMIRWLRFKPSAALVSPAVLKGDWKGLFSWDIRNLNPVYATIYLFFIVRASIGIPCLIALVVYGVDEDTCQ
ncbi:hypothetical protein LguiB_013288 [Lonicera macranthoides]